MSEDNEKQNSAEFYTNKYQKYIACVYEYMSGFEKCKEELPNKEKFYSSLVL